MGISVSSELPLPAEQVRSLLESPALLAYVAWPVLTFDSLPETFVVGAPVRIRLTTFGVLPLWWHTIEVVESDDGGAMTQEHGGPVRRWQHRLSVEPLTADSCRYRDDVQVDAGPLTPAVTAFAHLFYRWRHHRWRSLAGVLRSLDASALTPAGAPPRRARPRRRPRR